MVMARPNVVPLIIHGQEIRLPEERNNTIFPSNPDIPSATPWLAQGATEELSTKAVQSCADAFPQWKKTLPKERQILFTKLVKLLRERADDLQLIIEDEIGCSSLWASINVQDAIAVAEQTCATVTSGVLSGIIPEVQQPGTHAAIFKEPLGVILAIAPWNAPAVLGMRSIAAPVAAGNCVVFKGSELSPRTHYFLATLFQDAGFPPGVVNFLTHRPEDAPVIFETLISHKSIRKCNFTGSTAVGRQVAMRAAYHLKPVLLELGGKNFAIVLDDADVTLTAKMILQGAFLNTGQICMSTDLVLVSERTKPVLCRALRAALSEMSAQATHVISAKSRARIHALLQDAANKGAQLITAEDRPDLVKEDSPESRVHPTIIEGVTKDMDFWELESFGPVVGLATVADIDEAVSVVNSCEYGLSAAIFTKSDIKAIHLGRKLDVASVHINGPTVHDEATLPHGGFKNSGWGRFGGHWAFEEFLQTKTVLVNDLHAD
ncbi:hypothetical protein SBRCBS47491_002361 [Sporothrix bragantina]|uniref:Aldehyde dehydrogenase domain-containing protein n=1 Tax=Sporothrix bragantina TaxID=671064 RepID=A0ABP0B677_9PEZI